MMIDARWTLILNCMAIIDQIASINIARALDSQAKRPKRHPDRQAGVVQVAQAPLPAIVVMIIGSHGA